MASALGDSGMLFEEQFSSGHQRAVSVSKVTPTVDVLLDEVRKLGAVKTLGSFCRRNSMVFLA